MKVYRTARSTRGVESVGEVDANSCLLLMLRIARLLQFGPCIILVKHHITL